MSNHDDSNRDQDQAGGTVSEGGSGALNADTALGGADNLPDTPDVNKGGGLGANLDDAKGDPGAEGAE